MGKKDRHRVDKAATPPDSDVEVVVVTKKSTKREGKRTAAHQPTPPSSVGGPGLTDSEAESLAVEKRMKKISTWNPGAAEGGDMKNTTFEGTLKRRKKKKKVNTSRESGSASFETTIYDSTNDLPPPAAAGTGMLSPRTIAGVDAERERGTVLDAGLPPLQPLARTQSQTVSTADSSLLQQSTSITQEKLPDIAGGRGYQPVPLPAVKPSKDGQSTPRMSFDL